MPPTCNTRDNARNERNKRNETNERYEQTIDVGGIMPVDLIYFVLDSCFFPCAENKLWVGMVCRWKYLSHALVRKHYHVRTIDVGCAVASSFIDDSTWLICGRRAWLSIGSPFHRALPIGPPFCKALPIGSPFCKAFPIGSPFHKALANYVFYLDPKFQLPAGSKRHMWICSFSTYPVLNFYVSVVAWLLIACQG
jgi:hypothetical protein